MTQPSIDQAIRAALALFRAGNAPAAERLCREVLGRAAEQADALDLLGTLALSAGQPAAAVDFARRAVAARPDQVDFLFNLGVALRQMQHADEAIAVFQRVAAAQPEHAAAHAHLGDLYRFKRDDANAAAAYLRAVELKPDYAAAWNNYGLLLFNQRKLEESVAAFRHVLAAGADLAEVHSNLGNSLRDLGKPDEALACYDRALSLRPNFAIAYSNRSNTLRDLGRFEEARADAGRALALDPNLPEAHWNSALLLLLTGDLPRGWAEYEWRWRWSGFPTPIRPFSQPLWTGENPAGKTILLHCEQGLGDTIQFIRYASHIARRGAKVVLECPAPLVRLMATVPGVRQVIGQDSALSNGAENGPTHPAEMPAFDLHLPLLSLPLIFQTSLATIPREVPYVRADLTAVEQWRRKMEGSGAALRVGLAWAGARGLVDDKRRSLSLSALAPLTQAAGVKFYSLQKDDSAGESRHPPPGMELIDYTADLADFADTAALVANLDLVITVDTAVAHLAGAMGKPAWVLIPFIPDWRWLLNRTDSPWYPTLRLFRQKSRGDWSGAIADLAAELTSLARGGDAGGRV